MAENYREYGKTVIDGELVINGTLTVDSDATVSGIVSNAKTDAAGIVKMAAAVASVDTGDAATAAGNATAINAILAALQTAGIMATST